jgi:hypothetical protein
MSNHRIIKHWALDELTGNWECHNVCVAKAGQVMGGQIYPRALKLAVDQGQFDWLPLVFDHMCVDNFIIGHTTDRNQYLDGRVYSDIVLTNPNAIVAIVDEGCKQLSIGYRTRPKKINGTFQGKAFDSLDCELEINHLALVDLGELGAECSF